MEKGSGFCPATSAFRSARQSGSRGIARTQPATIIWHIGRIGRTSTAVRWWSIGTRGTDAKGRNLNGARPKWTYPVT
jgi:hypothetical protein